MKCPDISRHLENRLRQADCFGVFGMIKLSFTGKTHKRKISIFRREHTMCNKNLKTLSCMVLVTGALSGLTGCRRKAMSKYNTLWEYVQKSGKESFQLTFEEIQEIAGYRLTTLFRNIRKGLQNMAGRSGKYL